MNDEVSVAELLEREGWTQADEARKGRLRVVAVMLAVVLGCGLAAILVHLGAQDQRADGPSVFSVPHGPTGGLAGGGIPSDPTQSQKTVTDTTVVVTNQAGPVFNGVPWSTGRHSATETAAGSTSNPSVTQTPTGGPDTPTGTSDGKPTGATTTMPGNGGGPSTAPSAPCILHLLFC